VAEGFFEPSQCPIPGFPPDRLVAALVRVLPRTVLHLDWARDADEARTLARNEAAADGAEHWYRYFLPEDAKRVVDPQFSMGMVRFEFCRHLQAGGALPAEVLLDGGGTGFAIDGAGHILTNYHLVTSEIGNWARTAGALWQEVPCRSLRVQLAVRHESGAWEWRDAKEVYLVSNPPESRAILDLGNNTGELREDVALLRIEPVPPHHLELATRLPTLGESVWMAGFPLRSARSDATKARHEYRDADGTLRVSRGRVTSLDGEDYFRTDCDGSMGNSGSPVFSSDGAVLGMFSRATGDGPRNAFEYGHLERVNVTAALATQGLRLRSPDVG
jgi:S1-C subfamily serine protease